MWHKNSPRRGNTLAFQRTTLKNIIIQLAMVCIVAALLCIKSWTYGYSALIGGLVYLIPYSYAASRLILKTKNAADNAAKQALADLYIGQIWKMVISVVLFALVFVLVKPLSPFSLFGAYIAVQVLGWYLQMCIDKRFIKL